MLPIYWPDRGLLASRVTVHAMELISALKIVKQQERLANIIILGSYMRVLHLIFKK
jgi:hypothetical protein